MPFLLGVELYMGFTVREKLRYGLLENRPMQLAILVLIIAFLLGMIASYSQSHPIITDKSVKNSVEFNGTTTLHVRLPDIEEGVSFLNQTLYISVNTTTTINIVSNYPPYTNTTNIQNGGSIILNLPESRYTYDIILYANSTSPCKLHYEYRVRIAHSPYLILGFPAMLLTLIGMVLSIIGFITYMQKLIESR